MREKGDSWVLIDVGALDPPSACVGADMGIHLSDKVYGFLEVVAKTGRVETNGGSGESDTQGRPWEEVSRRI